MLTKLFGILSCALLLMSISCASTQNTAGDNSKSIKNIEWKLLSLTNAVDGSPISIEEGVVPTLQIDADNKVSGKAGCNRYFGGATIEGSKIQFSKMGATQMACPKGMDTERAFLDMLTQVDSYAIAAGQLVLLKGEKAIATFSNPASKLK